MITDDEPSGFSQMFAASGFSGDALLGSTTSLNMLIWDLNADENSSPPRRDWSDSRMV